MPDDSQRRPLDVALVEGPPRRDGKRDRESGKKRCQEPFPLGGRKGVRNRFPLMEGAGRGQFEPAWDDRIEPRKAGLFIMC
jgi:hypothetical protein